MLGRLFFVFALALVAGCESSSGPSGPAHDASDLPNLVDHGTDQVTARRALTLRLELPPGWKINEQAPSRMALEEKTTGEWAVLARFGRDELLDAAVNLPALTAGAEYRLEGTLYYCEKDRPEICKLASTSRQLIPREGGETSVTVALPVP